MKGIHNSGGTNSGRACQECGGAIGCTRPRSAYCGLRCYRKSARRTEVYKQGKREWKKRFRAKHPRLRASLRECGKMMRGERPIVWKDGSTAAYRVFLLQHKGKCDYCRKDCSDSYHIDHFIPVSLGGKEQDWNLRVSCPSCNIRKGEELPFGWLTNTYRENCSQKET